MVAQISSEGWVLLAMFFLIGGLVGFLWGYLQGLKNNTDLLVAEQQKTIERLKARMEGL